MTHTDLGHTYQRFLQMFWDSEPKNDEPGCPPIICLGKTYHSHDFATEDQHLSQQNSTEELNQTHSKTSGTADELANRPWPEPFLQDFEARFWFTYRTDFQPIPRSQDPRASAALTLTVRIRNIAETNGFTSDTGWGCMIRSGQCLLANTIALLRFGRDWRRGQVPEEEKQLIALFADDPRSPFSIHRFVEHGATHCGKHPGEWFGPSATAQCIKDLSHISGISGPRVYIAEEGAQIFRGSVESLAYGDTETFRPILLLAGVRLGIDRITPLYQSPLKDVFKIKQFVGIAGGRPSASHYFFAVQGNHLFYLDPHQTKQALPYHPTPGDYSDQDVTTLHTRRLRRLHIDRMDPSMLLSFLITSLDDLDDFKDSICGINGQPILSIVDGLPPGEHHQERESALDEVEAFDESDDDILVDENAIPRSGD